MQSLRLRGAAAAVIGLSISTQVVLAQTSPDSQDDLRNQVQQMRQQLERLEKRLEQQDQQARQAAPAASPSEREQGLQQRVEELDQQVKVLGRKQELQQEDTVAAKKDSPKIDAGEGGLVVKSADGQNEFRLRGLLQVDGRFFTGDQPSPGVDTFLLRRVRPIFEGTLFGLYDFRFTPDFGGGKAIVQDAYIDARFEPYAKLRVGKFKAPVSLERLQSAQFTRFVERAYPSNDLLPNRDIGAQLHGEVLDKTLEYQVGVFNGSTDGRNSDDYTTSDQDNNSGKDIDARIFAQPFRNGVSPLQGLGFGIAGTFANLTGRSGTTQQDTNLSAYRSLAQQTIFSYRTGVSNGTYAAGNRVRWTPQAYYYWNSLGVIGEFAQVSQEVRRNVSGTVTRDERLNHNAWQIAASYVLTGEDNGFRGIKPAHPFKPGGTGWGAWEVGARYTALNLDSDAFTGGANSFADPAVSVKSAKTWGAVLNWYLNTNVRLSFDYETTKFDGGAGTSAAPADREDENLIFARFQVAF